MTETGLTSEDTGAVRILTLNRPACRNALDTVLCRSLLHALRCADADPAIAVVVLAGAGGHFCAGADIREFPQPLGALASRFRERTTLLADIQLCLDGMEKPVIAAVDGAAVGVGASLALCCDLFIAADTLRFGFPELRKGILPAMVLASLHRALPRQQAFALIATAALIGAEDAERLGLVTARIAGPAREPALALARSLAQNGPDALRAAKALFTKTESLSFANALHAGRAATLAARGLAADECERP